jgi:hypothetical protein
MLETKKRRFWFVMSGVWLVGWLLFCLLVELNSPGDSPERMRYFGISPVWRSVRSVLFPFLLFGVLPVASGWGVLVGLPATIKWIRGGK